MVDRPFFTQYDSTGRPLSSRVRAWFDGRFATKAELSEVASGQALALSDATVAGLLADPGTAAGAAHAAKADEADVLALLDGKADATTTADALAAKADSAAVDAALAEKADAFETATALAGKADGGAVDAALELKADVSVVAEKADAVTVDAKFVTVDAAITQVGTDLDGKLGTATAALTYVQSNRPVWARGDRSFDPVTGLYNASARNLNRWRTACGEALAGVGQAHVSVIGDSVAAHMWTAPAETSTWPGQLKRMLAASLGSGGSGIVVPWSDLPIPGTSVFEPRIITADGADAGFVVHQDYGLFSGGSMGVHDVADARTSYIHFKPTETVDEFWIYAIGTGYRTRLLVDESTQYELGAYVGDSGATAGWNFVPAKSGYVRSTNAVDGGLRVFQIPVNPGLHQVKILGNGVGRSIIVGMEGRRAGGVRVSNLSLGGVSIAGLFLNNDELNGYRGLPLAFDVPNADLAILALHINDWQNHRDIATFKNYVVSAVNRQRAVGPTGTNGFGTGAAGDVLLMVNAQPDYANHPPDHVQVPALSEYYQVLYEVADELDVPLLDNAYRWTDYATSQALFRDFIHPTQAGAADIARAAYTALMSV